MGLRGPKPKWGEPGIGVTVYLSRKLLAVLRRRADAEAVSVSNVTQRALTRFFSPSDLNNSHSPLNVPTTSVTREAGSVNRADAQGENGPTERCANAQDARDA